VVQPKVIPTHCGINLELVLITISSKNIFSNYNFICNKLLDCRGLWLAHYECTRAVTTLTVPLERGTLSAMKYLRSRHAYSRL
jgi:hypothetical protein